MEPIVFAVGLIVAIGFMTWREHLQSRAHEVREKQLLRMVADLQNRLTAKDLQGYQMLHQMQEREETPTYSTPLNDEELAKIEEVKRSLSARALANQI